MAANLVVNLKNTFEIMPTAAILTATILIYIGTSELSLAIITID